MGLLVARSSFNICNSFGNEHGVRLVRFRGLYQSV